MRIKKYMFFFQITFDIESSSAGLRKVVLYDVLTKAAIPAVANLKLMNRLSADWGAAKYAYSELPTTANISEIPMSIFCGIW